MPEALNLLEHGDSVEQSDWERIREYFPLYEEFWRRHLVPLRSPGTISLRSDLDADVECLAMHHYSCFVALSRAFRDGSEGQFDDPVSIFANLQRACEMAEGVRDKFRELFRRCTGRTANVTDQSIQNAHERVRPYRNFLHKPIMGTLRTRDGDILVPKQGVLGQYPNWSSLRGAPDEDLVAIRELFWNLFRGLCSALQNTWKDMMASSSELLASRKYQAIQAGGSAVSQPVQELPQGWALSSSGQLRD